MRMDTLQEPARNIPVIHEADICVVGGSCTGVFAAVRAARLGARVAMVEKQSAFGGVATQGLVNIWHSLYDVHRKRQIIAGLTEEVIARLRRRDAVEEDSHFRLNTEELKIDLDELVTEAKVEPFLHTLFAAPFCRDGRLDAVIVESKSGRGAIRARQFIDATGDGDLAAALGLAFHVRPNLQPPSMCARTLGAAGVSFQELMWKHRGAAGLEEDWGWSTTLPGVPGGRMHAETHVFGVNCAAAADLTRAEIEGRRQVRAYLDLARKHTDKKPVLLGLPSYVGIRETRRFTCDYRLTEKDLLSGRAFEDTIACGTYPVDMHHSGDKPGITFRNLDGSEITYDGRGNRRAGRWLPEGAVGPDYYQMPYRCLLAGEHPNLLLCGRAIDADEGAFGAIRVMVNLNQTGEAAGVAAWCALQAGVPVRQVDPATLRRELRKGGSALP
jgi:hypothetical protein